MKVEKPKHILKTLSNQEWPTLSSDDIRDTFRSCSASNNVPPSSSAMFTALATPEIPVMGLMTPCLRSCCELSTRLAQPLRSTPRITSFLSPVYQPDTPRTRILCGLGGLVTPRPGSGVLCNTPSLTTPMVAMALAEGFRTPRRPTRSHPIRTPQISTPRLFDLCQLSTPTLFPTNQPFAVPDILEIIDNKSDYSSEHLEQSLRTYDVTDVTDDNVVDFLLDMGQCNLQPPPQTPRRKIMLPPRGGRHSKRLTKAMEDEIKEQQKKKKEMEAKIARAERQRKRKARFAKQDNAEGLRRRVARGGRCTRSLVKACKKVGLARSEREVESLLAKHDKHCNEEE